MNSNPTSPRAICIYGASEENINPAYKDAAFRLGQLIAESGHPLICGGGRRGLMRAAIDGALSAGGDAIGVLPRFMVDKEWQHPALSQMITTPDMHSRKNTMASLSIAAIALPGGVGTFEELLEIITWRKLGLYKGRVIILNTLNYYDPLIQMLRKSAGQGFTSLAETPDLWEEAETPEDAIRKALSL